MFLCALSLADTASFLGATNQSVDKIWMSVWCIYILQWEEELLKHSVVDTCREKGGNVDASLTIALWKNLMLSLKFLEVSQVKS